MTKDFLQDISLIQQRLQEVATPTVSMAASGYASSGESTLLGASKASARQGQLLLECRCMRFCVCLPELTPVTSSCRGVH